MKNVLKIISGFIVMLLLVSTFLFLCFEMHEHQHECENNNCPICCELNVAKNASKIKISASIILAILVLFFEKKLDIKCINNQRKK